MQNKGGRTSDSRIQEFYHRECFYLDIPTNYYYLPNPQLTNFLEDIKQILAQYSAGISLEKVDEFVNKLTLYSSFDWQLHNPEHYYLATSFASYIYLRKSTVEFDKLQVLLPFDDRLISYIIGDKVEMEYSLSIHNTSPYIHLINFVIQDTKSISYIDSFLLQFYASLEQCSWHDSHIHDTAQFFGYWSFALAAIVKKMKISDTSFVDHMFYPRDLTGQELLPTWEDSSRGENAREKKEALIESTSKAENWIDHDSLRFFDRVLPQEMEKVLREQEEKLFSEAFLFKLRELGDDSKKVIQYENPKKLRALLTQFANEIIKSEKKQQEIKDAFSMEVIQSHLAEKLQGSYAAMPVELKAELENYFQSDEAKTLLDQNTLDYKQLGHDILHINTLHSAEDEEYWDSMEKLMINNNIMSPAVPEEIIEEDISKLIKSNLKKRIGDVNFKVSLKDYL